MNIIGILLAAGHSRRFGAENKLLQTLPDGSIMALAAASQLLKALPCSVAVVRPDALDLNVKLANVGMNTMACNDNQQLMADSLAAGIRFANSLYPQAQGYIVALADMPFVRVDTIKKLAEMLLQGHEIVIPRYSNSEGGVQRGNPVGFSARFSDELMQITGDHGARMLFEKYPTALSYLESDDQGILQDIDTPDDLQKQ